MQTHSQEELDTWRLVRVSEDFRVIALGLPSPRYPGHPLDPPFRSRFQARHISPPSFEVSIFKKQVFFRYSLKIKISLYTNIIRK